MQAMLEENSAFGRKAVTDKYGRKVKHEIKEDLSKFYDIDDGEDDDKSGHETAAEQAPKGKKGTTASKACLNKYMLHAYSSMHTYIQVNTHFGHRIFSGKLHALSGSALKQHHLLAGLQGNASLRMLKVNFLTFHRTSARS